MSLSEGIVDRNRLHFVLIRENTAVALVQSEDGDAIVLECLEDTQKEEVIQEITSRLLAEPESAYMEEIGNWDYMKQHCFSQANLYGPFLWAYFDPIKGLRCGFEIEVNAY